MPANKIKTALLLTFSLCAYADEPTEHAPPYQVPTFNGGDLDFHDIKPAPNPAKTVDADLIVHTVNACYPVPAMN